MTFRITKHGEDVLKKKTALVDLDAMRKDLPKLLKDMWETMYAANGVGLAAPQVGLSLRLAVIDVKPEGKSERLVLINPEIVSREGAVVEEEGCLSIPGLYVKTKRHAKVRVRALDADGKPWERTGTGLLARAFEHEVDHLDGKLFIDHLDLVRRLKVAAVLKDLKKTWT
jgi:peptide deformylase